VHDRIAREGVIIGLLAYVMWGIFPVYFKILDTVDPTEMLAHRVVWAVPFGGLIILMRKQWAEIRKVLSDKKTLGWLGLAALAISVNWFIYIWAVQNEQIFETSLGYYINPLMYVLAGVVLLGERLRRLQMLAVVLAFIGVMILTISGGELPWVSISLALLFTLYGTIRKQIAVGAMPGLFIETVMLLPFALIWLLWLLANGQSAFVNSDLTTSSLLLLAGPVTVLPLLCFAIAARRLTLTTIGFMQFLAPTLQFGIAIYYGETLTTAHLICFGFIWAAVLFFSIDAVRASKKLPTAIPKGA
jgi:chloramphenicol-sensitive protein RarD